jgi:uncharacterized membrane protein
LRRIDRRLRLRRAGVALSMVFFCVSLTPSLLPRPWLAQGLISGLATATGYGIGVVIAWTASWLIPRRWHLRRPTRPRVVRTLIALAALLVLVSLYAGSTWQRDLYLLMGGRPPGRLVYVRVPVIAGGLAVGVIALTRVFRAAGQLLARLLRRWLPDGPLQVVGVAFGLIATLAVAESVALGGFRSAADRISALVNDVGNTGLVAPNSPLRSGSPASLVSWSSLGREGRLFVTGGPTLGQLRAFDGPDAREPIRAYVGLRSVGGTRAAADLAVRELERTGAFDRSVLCVVTTTGTGWVDPYLTAALEYLHHGDTAIVGVQYSYLPSWISFLSEQQRVAVSGPELFDAVQARWKTLPVGHRPTLLVFAESLGSLGSEAGFRDLDDVRARTNGVLWAGPTNANPLWRRLVADRDQGTLQVLPTYRDGTTVRFVSRPQDLDFPSGPWDRPRVVYLQNASDPVTWWSPDLLWNPPDWLEEHRGRDILPAMRWFPVVTFLQVTADLALAYGAPPGHGHQFHTSAVAAWTAIDPPPGWTPAKTAALTTLLGP